MEKPYERISEIIHFKIHASKTKLFPALEMEGMLDLYACYGFQIQIQMVVSLNKVKQVLSDSSFLTLILFVKAQHGSILIFISNKL